MAKTCFVAAILNCLILGGNRGSDIVVPAIFEISIPKTSLGQSFMLLSGSAHQFHISTHYCGYLFCKQLSMANHLMHF